MQQHDIEYITPEAYLAMERVAETKSEYFNGEMFAMAGASENHSIIVSNLIIELGSQLRRKPCRIYPGDMRIRVSASGLYTYPDVTVVCGEREFSDSHNDMLLNPDVIIEVLSDSTESYDRGRKFWHYRNLTSLREYLLVSQSIRRIERYFLNKNGNWELTETRKDSPTVTIEAIDCELNLDAVYVKTEGISEE